MQSIIAGMIDTVGSPATLLVVNVIMSGLLAYLFVRYRRLTAGLREEQDVHRELIENLSEGIYRALPDGRHVSGNKALVKLNGYGTEAEMLREINEGGKEWYVEPGRHGEFLAILYRDGQIENFVSEIYRYKTRERIWISESARLVRDKATGKAKFYEGSVREITETVNRLKAEEMLRKLSSQVPGGLFQFLRRKGGQYSVPYASSGFVSIFGFADEGEIGDNRQFMAMVDTADRQLVIDGVRRSGERMEALDLEFRITAFDGKQRWLRCTAQPEAVEDGIMWHAYINDVSARKQNEMEIEKLAFYDPLTGLPNRRKFMDRMSKALARSREKGTSGALIFIDLDNFKTLNDTRGHDVGDEYLAKVASRLVGCVGEHDTVARIGGDEFVIILEGIGQDYANASRAAIMTANKVLWAMREDFQIGLFNHRASASLGVVVFDSTNARAEDILKHADIAMYQAKAAGRNGMALYDHLSMSSESERYRLLNDPKTALADNALELHYQPQLDENGCIVGAEALCRWRHPDFGTLLPERFVPLTEQFGLIREFGNVVLAKGVETLAHWKTRAALRDLRLAVNVNVQSFACDDFVPNLVSLIEQHGVDPRLLTLELTESVLAKDRKLIARRMNELKELGVRLSLDDFGSGYSSLAQLKRLPFDELKIDGSFVADIETGESDRALVKSILGTARTLKLTAVAEHVENVRQEAFLRAFGCDYFQGFLYSPALSRDAFVEFVERRQPSGNLAFEDRPQKLA